MISLNLIVVVLAVFREPNEHHEVPKRQRGKHSINLLALKTSQAITFVRILLQVMDVFNKISQLFPGMTG